MFNLDAVSERTFGEILLDTTRIMGYLSVTDKVIGYHLKSTHFQPGLSD